MLQDTLENVEKWRALLELVEDAPHSSLIKHRCAQKLHQLELDLNHYRPAGRAPVDRRARASASLANRA